MSDAKRKTTDQSQKFIDAAKDLGADVDEQTLREKLGKLAKAKSASSYADKPPQKGRG